MCKYCEWTEETSTERYVDITIGEINDGADTYSLELSRYETFTGEPTKRNSLYLYHVIDTGRFDAIVQQKEIPIQYCPFCGEKL